MLLWFYLIRAETRCSKYKSAQCSKFCIRSDGKSRYRFSRTISLAPVTIHSDWLRPGRSGIESRWGRDFRPVQTGPGAHPASCKMGTGSFPAVKCGRGVLLTTHPLLVPRSVQLYSYTAIQLYLYPPSGTHRTCNGITLPLFLPVTIILPMHLIHLLIHHQRHIILTTGSVVK